MDPLRELGRTLLLLGGLLVLIGAFLYFGGKLPLRFGKLPGDIIHRGEHTTFYFPIVTCLLISTGFSVLFWLISYFRR
jgi:Protein of unknown function (DUF2905)